MLLMKQVKFTFILISAVVLRSISAADIENANNFEAEGSISLRREEMLLNSNISPGTGYSEDTQQVAPQRCYNMTISSTSGQEAMVQLDTAMSFSELENSLGMSVSLSGSYLMFSADAQASYMRSIEDKDYSLSLNYYEYATNNVALQLSGYGADALTESGKSFYNDGKNKYFGILCGDNYITSYKQGALLTMGIVINFSSSAAKQLFEEKAGASFGSIVSATETVKKVAAQNKISGSVSIQAFQIGGQPNRLSKILSKDSSGKYYALTCSLTSLDDCVKAASGLLDYAKDDFSAQFSFETNTGLTPLGIAFTQYNPIKYIGLAAPSSLVNQEIVKCRHKLSDKLKENKYYQQKVYPFFNQGYPVPLDSVFIAEANYILSKANNNVNILMQAHGAAADCFNFPDNCVQVKSNIDSQLENITESDLMFLKDVKFKATTMCGEFYNTGGGLASSWTIVPLPTPPFKFHRVRSVSITDSQYSFDTEIYLSALPFKYEYSGTSSDGVTFIGTLCFYLASNLGVGSNCSPNSQYVKQKLPFYFELYNKTELIN